MQRRRNAKTKKEMRKERQGTKRGKESSEEMKGRKEERGKSDIYRIGAENGRSGRGWKEGRREKEEKKHLRFCASYIGNHSTTEGAENGRSGRGTYTGEPLKI